MSHDFDQTLRILTGSLQSLESNEFNALEADAVATLVRGNKLVFSGLGKNVPICDKVVGTLNSVGLAAAFVHTNSAVHGDLGVVRAGDLVVILTKSGDTAESVHLSRLLNQRACTQWLLTFSRDSVLYREIPKHVVLNLEHEGDAWNILPNNSTVLNLIVLQELAMCLIEHFRVPLRRAAREPSGWGDRCAARCRGARRGAGCGGGACTRPRCPGRRAAKKTLCHDRACPLVAGAHVVPRS